MDITTVMNRYKPINGVSFNRLHDRFNLNDDGVSSLSIKSMHEVMRRKYKPVFISHIRDTEGNYLTKVFFVRNNDYSNLHYVVFTGLSSGYGGEGCRAFSFILMESINYPRPAVDRFNENIITFNNFIRNMKPNIMYGLQLAYLPRLFDYSITNRNLKVWKIGCKLPEVKGKIFFDLSGVKENLNGEESLFIS